MFHLSLAMDAGKEPFGDPLDLGEEEKEEEQDELEQSNRLDTPSGTDAVLQFLQVVRRMPTLSRTDVAAPFGVQSHKLNPLSTTEVASPFGRKEPKEQWGTLNATFPTTERAFPEWTRNAVRVPFGSLRESEAEYLEIERRRENDKMEAQEHRTALVGELVDIQAFVATHPELLNRVSYFTGWSSRRIDDEGAHPLGMLLACFCKSLIRSSLRCL
jgi:hypothetical protein